MKKKRSKPLFDGCRDGVHTISTMSNELSNDVHPLDGSAVFSINANQEDACAELAHVELHSIGLCFRIVEHLT